MKLVCRHLIYDPKRSRAVFSLGKITKKPHKCICKAKAKYELSVMVTNAVNSKQCSVLEWSRELRGERQPDVGLQENVSILISMKNSVHQGYLRSVV